MIQKSLLQSSRTFCSLGNFDRTISKSNAAFILNAGALTIRIKCRKLVIMSFNYDCEYLIVKIINDFNSPVPLVYHFDTAMYIGILVH